MRWMLRTAAAGSFVTAATTLAVTAHPSWATDLGGLWYVMDDQRNIRATEASHARMDREAETVLGRIACKEEIVQDVLDGRLRPDEAAARFAELNRGYPPGPGAEVLPRPDRRGTGGPAVPDFPAGDAPAGRPGPGRRMGGPAASGGY
jgi:hypothetical protein